MIHDIADTHEIMSQINNISKLPLHGAMLEFYGLQAFQTAQRNKNSL